MYIFEKEIILASLSPTAASVCALWHLVPSWMAHGGGGGATGLEKLVLCSKKSPKKPHLRRPVEYCIYCIAAHSHSQRSPLWWSITGSRPQTRVLNSGS